METNPLWILGTLYGLVILGVVGVIVSALLRIPRGHSTSLRDIFRQSRFLELTTVLVIIISGTYLSVIDKASEGIIALLSGIAGYVLGGLREAPQPGQPPDASAATRPAAADASAATRPGDPTGTA